MKIKPEYLMCVKQLMAEFHAETAEQLGDTEGPL